MNSMAEAHGGCTYCASAALRMMGRLADLPRKDQLTDWCVKRQNVGFQGRIEKPEDSCYSFWVGGSLKLLGLVDLVNGVSCSRFLKSCEFAAGGFQKFPDMPAPDLLHSYFSICGLSLCGLMQPIEAQLNMSQRAYDAFAERCGANAEEVTSSSTSYFQYPAASRQ